MNEINKDESALQEFIDDLLRLYYNEALKVKPVYTLEEILPLKTVAELRTLAKLNQITAYNKMRKAELVSALREALPNPRIMQMALGCLKQEEYDLFKRAAKHKQAAGKKLSDDSFIPVQGFGYLQAFYYEGEFNLVVPEEISRAYSDMISDGTAAAVERFILIDRYAQAAANLYGIITCEELLELFNRQNKAKATEDELISVLLQHIYEDSDYCFWGEYLVNSEFEENDFEDVSALAENIEGKPRYIPPRDAFLQYGDPDYYEETPYLDKLENYVNDNLMHDGLRALDVVAEIEHICTVGGRMADVMGVFEEYGVVFQNKEEVESLMPFIIDVWNNTRTWANKGHTPRELSNNHNRPVLRVLPGGSKKPGRNDPCPCGSGKKYKKCCGRDD